MDKSRVLPITLNVRIIVPSVCPAGYPEYRNWEIPEYCAHAFLNPRD
ncbi:hypothetical protein [Paraburkholderia fungorum]|nr:hypothetical protein [Paraburkholderia fungorum]